MTYQDVLLAACALPATERVQLIEDLCASVPADSLGPPSASWIAEAQRRSAEYDAGRMPVSNWAEVRTRARTEAGIE